MEGYEVLHSIGSGSFGTVYMGKRKATNETVAIKKISKGGRQEREIRSLRQECEIQKQLHHPNIIKMLDSFETDDSVVVVTEYAWGDLCKLLMKERKLAGSRVQFIACNIVSALYFLHSHRILHRDIKPQNILIGLDAHAKLCDFGFARTMGMDTYVLTSIKGTPLYMAPEIVEQRPYDHTADLWSLGCILYELMVGTPPFFTSSLYELVNMIKHRDIYWPEYITGDCLSFLKGLLTKDPKKRLSWPDLLHHPFVREGVYINHTVGEFSLTKALSPSQELVKERQRENLQRKLGRYSKLIAKTAIKLKEAQKELKWCSDEGRMAIQTPLASPNGGKTAAPLKSPIGVPPQDPLKISPNLRPALPDAKNLKVMFRNLNIHEPRTRTKENRLEDDEDDDEDEKNSGASSCETMTSSSDCETDDSDEADEDSKTVIMDNHNLRRRGFVESPGEQDTEPNLDYDGSNKPDKPSSRGGSGQLWKSGALFTLHSFGSEDKPINSDEWVKFLMDTMKEVMENPKGLCEKHLLTLLVAPLRNHLAEPEVVEKIARLLSLPFTLDESVLEAEPGFLSTLQTLYLDTKVLPNMLYSCKLIVRRRRLEHGSVTFEEIPSILTCEDLEGLEKCWRLVTYLVYTDDDFVTQLCDSVCVLQAFAMLQLFLKLDAVRPDLTANTISILCHILRKFPSNKCIVEEIILDENARSSIDAHGELWRLITHSNASIQAQSIRIFAYLRRDSERMRNEFLAKRRHKLWKVFQTAAISEVSDLRKSAKFALRTFNYQQTSTLTEKSNSTCSNSGCRIPQGGTISSAVGSASGTCGDSNHSQQIQMDEHKVSYEAEPPSTDECPGVELNVLNQDDLPNETSR